MKNITRLFVWLIMVTMVLSLSVISADLKEDKKQKKTKRIIIGDEVHHIPEIDIELPDMDETLEELNLKMSDLNIKMRHLDREMSFLDEEFRGMENLDIEIPEIDIVIPPIPEFEVHIPPMRLDGMSFYFDGHWSASHLFRNLSDSEQVRLEALRSIARQDAEVAVPALEKIIREDPSPALRYKAVHYLGRYLDEEGVLSLLEDVIKNDSNIDVRKKAIYVLSKSKDPRAVDILESIVRD